MFLSRRLFSYAKWTNSTTEWLNSKWGRRFRIGLLAGTIVSYPVGAILTNGPLINLSFPWRKPVSNLPPDLLALSKEEYERFLDKETRLPKDAVLKRHLNNNIDDYDTYAAGSLGVRTGLNLAIPFFAQFKTKEDVINYFRQKSENCIMFLGEKLTVDWDTPHGEELASTFLLSQNALRFLFLRDLYAHDGYAALAQRSISWSTWTTFTSIFTYWLHKTAKIGGGSLPSFLGIYAVFLTGAYFANRHWYYLYRYMTDIHADAESSRTTFGHAEGGKEFYWNYLKRNRILRDMHPHLYQTITASGDIRGLPTPIIVRYEHLKDVNAEDDEIKQVVEGDD